MAWVATQFGRLFLCFRYGKGAKGTSLCREALHVSSTREARAEAKRLAAKLQLEIDAGTFDYSAWFPKSVRLRKLGLKPKELPTLTAFTQKIRLPLKHWASGGQRAPTTKTFISFCLRNRKLRIAV